MRITIAERLKPYSHTPGFFFLLPGSTLRFQIFPTLIRVHDLSGHEPTFLTEIQIKIQGPVQDFTVMQDLEKGNLLVWGHTADGYMRYKIMAAQGSQELQQPCFFITIEKEPATQLTFYPSQGFHMIPYQDEAIKKSTFFISQVDKLHTIVIYKAQAIERLSFGNHKAQDWDMMRRRAQMAEIFPLWLKLGQALPRCRYIASGGITALLDQCRTLIAQCDRVALLPAFGNLFLAAFEGGLSPRLHDDQHQGFPLPSTKEKASPLRFLTEGAAFIRQLFIQSAEDSIDVLPALPPELHCGRFLNIQCPKGILEMEWSKKVIRRMIFTATADATLSFFFQKELKQFRMRQKESDRGTVMPCGSAIAVRRGQQVLLDRFEK